MKLHGVRLISVVVFKRQDGYVTLWNRVVAKENLSVDSGGEKKMCPEGR